jgi:hypothetical protein
MLSRLATGLGLSRLASGLGLLWFLLLCVTSWIWGASTGPSGSQMVILLGALSLGIVSVAWGTVLTREGHARWTLGAVPLGALLGTALTSAGFFSVGMGEFADSFYPQIPFVALAVLLGVAFGVGVVLGYLLRRGARQR